MSEVQVLSAVQLKASYIFLAIGAVVLACGIYMGFTNDSGSLVAIVLLSSVGLFAVALSPLLKVFGFRIFNFAKVAHSAPNAEPESEGSAAMQSEKKSEAMPDTKAKAQPAPVPEVQPEVKTELQPDAPAHALPVVKADAPARGKDEIEPKPVIDDKLQSDTKIDGNASIAKLMNMSLGELLLTAMIKDPESAGRLVAQAISQAERP